MLQTLEHAMLVLAVAGFVLFLYILRRELRDGLWHVIGETLAYPPIAEWLIRRALRTPYSHLPSNDDPTYMQRWWLFNPYERIALRDSAPEAERQSYMAQFAWLPWSFRIHRIVREDRDPHMHDHPWNARTFILRGFYIEERLVKYVPVASHYDELCDGTCDLEEAGYNPCTGACCRSRLIHPHDRLLTKTKIMAPGCTQAIRFNEYHRIIEVSQGGVWTLFVTSRYQGTWGFLVNGVKVPYRDYV